MTHLLFFDTAQQLVDGFSLTKTLVFDENKAWDFARAKP